jgi:methylmalonyl-CoA mutase cobalamin-binding subunit
MSRDVVLELLHELAERLRTRGICAGIHLVGGAALAIAYYDRRATFDIDAVFSPTKPVLDVVAELAAERNLPADWLNNNAK